MNYKFSRRVPRGSFWWRDILKLQVPFKSIAIVSKQWFSMTFGKDVFVAKHFHSFSPSLRIITYLSKWQALHLCAKHYSIFHFLPKPMHISNSYLSFFRTYRRSRSVMFGPISGDHLFRSVEHIINYWPPFYTQNIQVVMEIILSE